MEDSELEAYSVAFEARFPMRCEEEEEVFIVLMEN